MPDAETLWEYLVRKLEKLNDNNRTAREIFEYVFKANSKNTVKPQEIVDLLKKN